MATEARSIVKTKPTLLSVKRGKIVFIKKLKVGICIRTQILFFTEYSKYVF